MNRETDSKTDHPSAEDIAREADVVAPMPVRPVDADWPDEEAENEKPYGDPDSVKDESPLKSLGEAISEPVRDTGKPDSK